MHKVDEHQNGKRVGQHRAAHGKEKADTEHHAGHGVGEHGKAVHRRPAPALKLRACIDHCCGVTQQCAGDSASKGHAHGVAVDLPDDAVRENAGYHIKREDGLVGPLLNKRHDEHHGKDRQQYGGNDYVVAGKKRITHAVAGRRLVVDAVVAEVEALDVLQKHHRGNRRHEHRHGDYGTASKIGHRPHHRGIELGGNDVVLTGDRDRNAEVGEGQEEAQNKSRTKCPHNRTQRRNVEGAPGTVAHQAAHRNRVAVNVVESVGKDQKRGRKRVDYVSDQQPPETVDRKRQYAEDLAHQPQTSEGIDHRKAVGDRRQKKR